MTHTISWTETMPNRSSILPIVIVIGSYVCSPGEIRAQLGCSPPPEKRSCLPANSSVHSARNSAYPIQRFLKSPKNEWIYTAWVWRAAEEGPEGAVNHFGVSVARSKDLVNWENICGHPIETPIKPDAITAIEPLHLFSGLMNNIALGFDAEGNPVVTFQKSDGDNYLQVYNASMADGVWNVQQMTCWTQRVEIDKKHKLYSSGIRTNAFGPVQLTEGRALIQRFVAAPNEKSQPKSGIYQLNVLPTGALGIGSADRARSAFPIPPKLIERVEGDGAVYPERGYVNRPVNWRGSSKLLSVTGRSASGSLESRNGTRAEDFMITWEAMISNRDRGRDCAGAPFDPFGRPDTKASDTCPGYFVTDLNLWRFFVDKVWSGTEAMFDLVLDDDSGTLFVGYYNKDRRMAVARSSRENMDWRVAELPGDIYSGWDAHNNVAIGIDSNRGVHVLGNMHSYPGHATKINYYYSKDFSLSEIYHSHRLTGNNEDSVTYPEFFRDPTNSKLMLQYRNGIAGDGETYIKLYETTNGQNKWTDFMRLFDGKLE
jgi:hypothetical protein